MIPAEMNSDTDRAQLQATLKGNLFVFNLQIYTNYCDYEIYKFDALERLSIRNDQKTLTVKQIKEDYPVKMYQLGPLDIRCRFMADILTFSMQR